jgi:lipopolysaccharide export system permease protein
LNEKQAAAYRAEAHQRLTWPILALALPLLALAVLFSSEFNRRGQVKRILAASFGMALLLLVYFACRSISIKQPWVSALLYLIVVGAVAFSIEALRHPERFRPHRRVMPLMTET